MHFILLFEVDTKRIPDKMKFHYTPKHASWLSAAEIEINVMDIEYIDGGSKIWIY